RVAPGAAEGRPQPRDEPEAGRDAAGRAPGLAGRLRPGMGPDSTRPAARLAAPLGSPVAFAQDCVGPAVAAAGTSGVVLLENLRFHPEEEKNDAGFAAKLAESIDVYVKDAFGSGHG